LNKSDAVNKKFKRELSSGIVSLVLLSILDQQPEPAYGYQIARLIGAGRPDAPIVKQGALYPVLRSLERSSLLESHVEPSVSAPPRRYYRVTELGHTTLRQWTDIWNQTKTFVDAIMEGSNDD